VHHVAQLSHYRVLGLISKTRWKQGAAIIKPNASLLAPTKLIAELTSNLPLRQATKGMQTL
jgi:hypothetical protein